MPRIPSTLTGAAGEHFVACRLSALGYPTALTRGGSPTVDLMVGSKTGQATISIQVKTSNWAWRGFKRKSERNHWEWDVGRKGLELVSNNILYAFVDMRWNDQSFALPDVFIVPSSVVADFLKPDWSRFMFWIMQNDKSNYHERWDFITNILEGAV